MEGVTVDQVREWIANGNYAGVVELYAGDSTPYVFRHKPSGYDDLRRSLSRSLGIPKGALVLVGSARLGFSLSPDQFGREFRSESDMDFDVVSERLFDNLWYDLLRLSRWKRANLPAHVQEWLQTHKTDRIYFGRAEPQRLIGAARLGGKWIRTFASLARVTELSSHQAHGMLFRTWDHFKLHHTRGLRQIRARLIELGQA